MEIMISWNMEESHHWCWELTKFARYAIYYHIWDAIRITLACTHIRSPWYAPRPYLVIRKRAWPWYWQIHNGGAMMLMMLMVMLVMRLMRAVIRVYDPRMESLLWMLRGQIPQVLLLLPHAVLHKRCTFLLRYTNICFLLEEFSLIRTLE